MIDTVAIKDAVSIYQLLEYEGVKMRGTQVWCPFCADEYSRNPGASVTTDGAHYTCWVCGFSGDVIAVAEELTGFDFKETCEWLLATFP